jgi:hypothetical protein
MLLEVSVARLLASFTSWCCAPSAPGRLDVSLLNVTTTNLHYIKWNDYIDYQYICYP